MIFDRWIKAASLSPHAYRYHSLLPSYGKDSVVGVGSARCGVDEDVHVVVDDRGGDGLLEHNLDVLGLKHLLQRVEGQPGKLGLDKVGPVLHDLQHVLAVGGLAVVLALLAGQLHAEGLEDGLLFEEKEDGQSLADGLFQLQAWLFLFLLS